MPCSTIQLFHIENTLTPTSRRHHHYLYRYHQQIKFTAMARTQQQPQHTQSMCRPPPPSTTTPRTYLEQFQLLRFRGQRGRLVIDTLQHLQQTAVACARRRCMLLAALLQRTDCGRLAFAGRGVVCMQHKWLMHWLARTRATVRYEPFGAVTHEKLELVLQLLSSHFAAVAEVGVIELGRRSAVGQVTMQLNEAYTYLRRTRFSRSRTDSFRRMYSILLGHAMRYTS